MFSKLTLVVAALLLCAIAPHAVAQCDPNKLKDVSELEKKSLVIDVRPDEINQFRGKTSFKNEASIAVVNMNPFLFSYSLKVDQTEIQDTGYLNFLKLLGSPVSDLIGSASAAARSKALTASLGGNLNFLIKRTEVDPILIPATDCSTADQTTAKEAFEQIKTLRDAAISNILLTDAKNKDARTKEKDANSLLFKKTMELSGLPADWKTLTEKIENATAAYIGAREIFVAKKDVIFDSSVDAKRLCTSADELLTGLNANSYPQISELKNLKKEISDYKSLVKELRSSALDYKAEYEKCPTRVKGLNYADNIVRLADELGALATAYEALVGSMIEETKGYEALKETIAKLETPVLDQDGKPVVEDGKAKKENRTLQREYTVVSQHDISALDITATAVPLGEDSGLPSKDFTPQRVIGDVQRAQADGNSAQSTARIVNVGATDSAQGVRVFAAAHRASFRAQAEESKDGNGGGEAADSGETTAGAKQIKAKGTIGARRFEISAGMAFSTLGRTEFKPVLGYPRNEQGEFIDPETGNTTTTPKLTQIVGISEQSSRRFAPLAMLHYRLPFHRKVFMSAGFTGKRDEYGVDLEYLIGPSVLYKNMFFTFGGYAGKQQKLAGDLFEGAPVEGDFAVRKDYKWGWAFSFTYKIPLGGGTSN